MLWPVGPTVIPAIINQSSFNRSGRRSATGISARRGFTAVANIKSQMKRNRQNEKRRLRNRAVRSELRTREKAAVAAAGTENETEALRLTIQRIDKAASKGVIHQNAAARRKSRLVARIKQAGQPAG